MFAIAKNSFVKLYVIWWFSISLEERGILFKSKQAWVKEISLEEQLLLDMDVLHCILYTPAATHLNLFIINKKGIDPTLFPF